MKQPYYILGRAKWLTKRSSKLKTQNIEQSGKTHFHGGITHKINNKLYLCVPLSEIATFFNLRVDDFLEPELLDALNNIKRKTGIFPILYIET